MLVKIVRSNFFSIVRLTSKQLNVPNFVGAFQKLRLKSLIDFRLTDGRIDKPKSIQKINVD